MTGLSAPVVSYRERLMTPSDQTVTVVTAGDYLIAQFTTPNPAGTSIEHQLLSRYGTTTADCHHHDDWTLYSGSIGPIHRLAASVRDYCLRVRSRHGSLASQSNAFNIAIRGTCVARVSRFTNTLEVANCLPRSKSDSDHRPSRVCLTQDRLTRRF